MKIKNIRRSRMTLRYFGVSQKALAPGEISAEVPVALYFDRKVKMDVHRGRIELLLSSAEKKQIQDREDSREKKPLIAPPPKDYVDGVAEKIAENLMMLKPEAREAEMARLLEHKDNPHMAAAVELVKAKLAETEVVEEEVPEPPAIPPIAVAGVPPAPTEEKPEPEESDDEAKEEVSDEGVEETADAKEDSTEENEETSETVTEEPVETPVETPVEVEPEVTDKEDSEVLEPEETEDVTEEEHKSIWKMNKDELIEFAEAHDVEVEDDDTVRSLRDKLKEID